MSEFTRKFLVRHQVVLAFLFLLAAGIFVYSRHVTTNPRGFFIDESSIAYNAHLISQTGRDEYGQAWPLYFRAFGEYKNPVYIYLLAAIFRITGPGIYVARMFSALLGVAAAIVIALVGWRLTNQRLVALTLMFTALLTPWLFVLSRVVVEVALYPFLIALFLFALQRVAENNRWGWIDALSIASTLALLTYTYSIGRLLAPMLTFGLLLFAKRAGLLSIARVWIAYAISLLPLVIFRIRHPGALELRFNVVTYLSSQSGYGENVSTFLRHYLNNINPWRMLVTGDPNSYQMAPTYGTGVILIATFALALAGICLLIVKKGVNAWWSFVIYGLVASFVPASLTREYFHGLRLSPVPVFLILLTVPALAWLMQARTSARRLVTAAAIVLSLSQGIYFQVVHERHRNDTARMNMFDADYSTNILPAAIAASGSRPIYLADAPAIPGYIQAFWFATLQHLSLDKFVMLSPTAVAPEGAVVISTEAVCHHCEIVFSRPPYRVYIAKHQQALTQLPDEALKAEIHPLDYPQQMRAGQTAWLRVAVKNMSAMTWRARERAVAPFQINLGNHWVDRAAKSVINDDGRAALPWDLAPGQECELTIAINAPNAPGDYLLELDMVQENNSWFGLKGSPTVRLPIVVN